MNERLSIMRSAWGYLWKRNKTGTIRGILTLVRDRPIAFFVLAIAVLNFRWTSIVVIPIIFLLNQILIELFIKGDVLATTFRVMFSGLFSGKYPVTAKQYQVSEYIPDHYEDVDLYFLRRFAELFGIRSLSIDNTIQVYHIKSDQVISTNITCYAMPILRSYIFFNDSPYNDVGPFQKFSFLHELAHACLKFTSGSPFASHGIKLYIVYFLFIYAYTDWKALPIWVLIGLITVVLFALIERIKINYDRRLEDEIEADSFALAYLSPSEREAMVEFKSCLALSSDNQLSPRQNTIRMQTLLRHIDLAGNNEDDALLQSTYSTKYKPGFLLVIVTSIMTVLPAFYAAPLDGWNVLILIAVTILLFIVFIFTHIFISAFQGNIDKRLKQLEEGYA